MGGIPEASALGFRRVSFVRVILGDGEPRCEAVGVSHRRTVTRPIPLRSAVALVRAGVPSVVRHPGGPTRRPRATNAGAGAAVAAGRRA